MSEISAFSLFCEDVRQEATGLSTLVGVCGGTLLVDSEVEAIDRLQAVCFARMPMEVDTISVRISASVLHDNNRAKAPDYMADFTRPGDIGPHNWELQLILNLKGMPIEEGAIAELNFEVNGKTSVARLSFTKRIETMYQIDELKLKVTDRQPGLITEALASGPSKPKKPRKLPKA